MSNFGDEVHLYEAKAKSYFVMAWGKLLKTYTALLAMLETFLLSFQAWAHNNTGDLALVSQAWWFQALLIGVAVAIPVVRNIRQPALAVPEAATPTLPTR